MKEFTCITSIILAALAVFRIVNYLKAECDTTAEEYENCCDDQHNIQ